MAGGSASPEGGVQGGVHPRPPGAPQNSADFEDSETHEIQKTVPQRVRETYLQEVERFCDYFKEKCRSGGMDYCLLNTSQPLNIALASYLSRRAKSF